ncbi:MAG TPA: aspartyl/asparaginyl beta-hydroxylase domain-containing protein [Gammaproteobacteria bacterium]|nr:aspartyl/asparaginyl beta-hydroxylase domain-containing protein [Gammaproteobacteria bacterium]
MTGDAARKERLAELNARAREVNQRGRREDVVPICKEILELNPNAPDALHFLGMWQLERKAYTEAADCLGRLAALLPDAGEVRVPLALALEESGQPEAALEHARVALRANPENYIPYLFLGSIFEGLGDIERASIAYSTAARLNPDGESLSDEPTHPAPTRERARRGNALIDRYLRELHAKAVERTRKTHPDADLTRVSAARWRRFHTVPVELTNPEQNPQWFYVPGLNRTGWFEREEFPWVEALEARAEEILAEVGERYRLDEDTVPYLTRGVYGKEYEGIVGTTNWGACRFYNGFKRNDEVCRRFPVTASVLDSLPLFRMEGNAMEALYSVLKAGKTIPVHQSVSNAKLTVHLPLVVPDKCYLDVQGEARQVEFGRCLIFDDTALHGARNESEEVRINLLFQVWHPDLSEVEREVIESSYAAHERWLRERSLDQLLTD